jgi:hypothetical protein
MLTKLLLSLLACTAAFAATHPSHSRAQQSAPAAAPLEIRGHYIGEPVKRFFRLDLEARGEMEVCRQNPNRPACGRLLDAIEYGKRADISTTVPADPNNPEGDRETTNFILDGGKLVKISMLANAPPEELKSLGRPTSEKSIPAHDDSGAKWENHLTIWDTPTLYVSLYLDNNPAIQDHRLTLTIEAPTEHARENPEAAESPKPSSAAGTPPAAPPVAH